MHLKPVRVGVGGTHSGECYSQFFEIQSFILTLNTLNTTDNTSQVNSFPFLDLFFGLNFKSRFESSAAISWPLVAWVEVSQSAFLLEMALESDLR